MIVTCENCDARFNLDENLIKESGSKLRCSKCHHIFTARKPVSVEGAESARELEEATADLPESAEAPPASSEVVEEAAEEALDFDLFEAEEKPPEEDVALEEVALEEEPVAEQPPTPEQDVALEEAPEEDLDLDLSEAEGKPPEEDVALEEVALEEEPAAEQPPTPEQDVALEEAPEEALDFDLFEAEEKPPEEDVALEEVALEEEPVAEQPPTPEQDVALEEAPEEDLDLDLSEAEEKPPEEDVALEEVALEEEPPADELITLEEETAEEKKEPEEESPDMVSVESLEGAEEEETEEVEEELMPPPLAEGVPSARRRLSTPLMIVLVLVLLVGGAFAAYGLLKTYDVRIPFLESLMGAPGSSTIDRGNLRIALLDQVIRSDFIENKTAGRLFVVRGKVRNDYPKARNLIMVRGVLYSKNGEAVHKKDIYCGNTLSDAELQDLDKATMDNRLGDKRSNVSVPSGKEIPFVVVFSDLPQDLGEFSVEVVSSAPA